MDPYSDIEDMEILYRGVRSDRNYYKLIEGKVVFSPSAFLDPNYRPSVDRALLCENNPMHTKRSPSDGVLSLVARDVRSISNIAYNPPKPQATQMFKAEIEPKPIAGEQSNPAHAQIYLDPDCPNGTVFDKLKARLAWLANQRQWESPPDVEDA